MGIILHEVRLGLRQMHKSPAFTIVAMLTLALGIGANTAVFTLLDQALLRNLPVSHPEQLVRLRFVGSNPGHTHAFGGDGNDYFSFPLYRDLRDKNNVFDGLIASERAVVDRRCAREANGGCAEEPVDDAKTHDQPGLREHGPWQHTDDGDPVRWHYAPLARRCLVQELRGKVRLPCRREMAG